MPDSAPPTAGLNHSSDSPGSNSLQKNILFAVGGMGVFYVCQFGVIILLAKFAPPEVLGQVEFSLAIATPIVLFCSFELRGALVADAAGEFTFGTYRRLRSLMMILAGAVLLGIAVWEAVSEQNLAYTIILAGLCAGKIILSLAEIGWGLFQKRERLDLMAASAALRGLLMLAAFGLIVPIFAYLSRRGVITNEQIAGGAALAITLYALASLALLLLFDRPRVAARSDYDPSWSWSAIRNLARQTFPLGIVLLVLHLCNSIPVLVIESQENGKAALGHFGALTKLTLVGTILVFQAANAAANRLARFYQTDLAAFLRLSAKLLVLALAVGLPILAVTLLFGQWLLRVLYRADYALYYAEFKIIVFAQCLVLLTTVFGVLTTQMRLFWLQVPVQIIVLLATAVAALLLIPAAEDPVRGGAWTVLTRSIVHIALYAGCVLFGILLRQRVLAKRVSLPSEPLGTPPGDTGQDW